LGLFYAFLAYSLWGVFPLYFHLLSHVSADEILVHRVIWSFVSTVLLIVLLGRSSAFIRAVKQPYLWRWLSVSALLISINWLVYIWAVVNQRIVEASLGYFMMPIVSVLMARLILKENMHILHWLAVTVASIAVLWEISQFGSLPWIAVILSLSFAGYGLVRKMKPVESLSGLTIETIVLMPFIAVWLTWQHAVAFDFQWAADTYTTSLLIGSGLVTALPLLLFAMGTARARLSSVGFLQYINPLLQMSIGVYILNEHLSEPRMWTFVCVWVALLIYGMGSWRALKE
jgi:chloramphenicol-sensitive protein RarD